MAKSNEQLFKPEQIVKIGNVEFEVMHVSSMQDEDGNPFNFTYELALKSDADKKRKTNADEAKRLNAEAEARSKKRKKLIANGHDELVVQEMNDEQLDQALKAQA